MNSRRKRHERQINPPRMRLTDRDKQAVEAVYLHRAMTQEQLQRLVFVDLHRSVAQRRLSLLYDHGYLDRRFLPTIGGIVTSPIVYVLDRRGNDLLLANMGYDEVRWQPKDNTIGYEHIEHLLTINTVRIEIALACQQLGYTLKTWLDDTTLKQDYDRVRIPGEDRPVSVIPDGYIVIGTPRGDTHLFLEVDRVPARLPSKRFKRRILAYIAYATSGLLLKRFGTAKFRVLFVTESRRRTENLKQAAASVGAGNRFWFGVLSDIVAPTVLNTPIWQVAGRTGAVALIE